MWKEVNWEYTLMDHQATCKKGAPLRHHDTVLCGSSWWTLKKEKYITNLLSMHVISGRRRDIKYPKVKCIWNIKDVL